MIDVELPSGPPGRARTGGFAACLVSVAATRPVSCHVSGLAYPRAAELTPCRGATRSTQR
jgi:hypothetical protein